MPERRTERNTPPELTELCKSNAKGALALAAEDIPDPKAASTVVTLRAIHSVENVNALKEGERLTFDQAGLTVVYGDNGSGKSGYARILKKACRARTPKGDEILPNIYGSNSAPRKAVIDFLVNGHNKSEDWRADGASDSILSSISVFDSRTANVHVDEVNDVAYTPFPMRVLERLAATCQEVKRRITVEMRDLEAQARLRR
jgi:energy-coupling factor transporter ATP-binding protein EcfA2